MKNIIIDLLLVFVVVFILSYLFLFRQNMESFSSRPNKVCANLTNVRNTKPILTCKKLSDPYKIVENNYNNLINLDLDNFVKDNPKYSKSFNDILENHTELSRFWRTYMIIRDLSCQNKYGLKSNKNNLDLVFTIYERNIDDHDSFQKKIDTNPALYLEVITKLNNSAYFSLPTTQNEFIELATIFVDRLQADYRENNNQDNVILAVFGFKQVNQNSITMTNKYASIICKTLNNVFLTPIQKDTTKDDYRLKLYLDTKDVYEILFSNLFMWFYEELVIKKYKLSQSLLLLIVNNIIKDSEPIFKKFLQDKIKNIQPRQPVPTPQPTMERPVPTPQPTMERPVPTPQPTMERPVPTPQASKPVPTPQASKPVPTPQPRPRRPDPNSKFVRSRQR
jgi:hypothetical protein